jgi:hypothetical protein
MQDKGGNCICVHSLPTLTNSVEGLLRKEICWEWLIYMCGEKICNASNILCKCAFVHLQTGWWSISLVSLGNFNNLYCSIYVRWSQWPRSVRHGSAATHLLRLWCWILPGAWMFACCEHCVLLGRGLCVELITHPEESYRLWCIIVCDLETSKWGGYDPPQATAPQGKKRKEKKRKKYIFVKIRGKETFDGGTRDAFLAQPWKLIFHVWKVLIKDKICHSRCGDVYCCCYILSIP